MRKVGQQCDRIAASVDFDVEPGMWSMLRSPFDGGQRINLSHWHKRGTHNGYCFQRLLA